MEQSNLDFSCHSVIQNMFLSLLIQKYLRRFYGLPAGLQGRQRSTGSFQAKIKEMQRFFNLKVTENIYVENI